MAIWGGGATFAVPTMTPFGLLMLCGLIVATALIAERQIRDGHRVRGIAVLIVVLAVPLIAAASPTTMPYLFTN